LKNLALKKPGKPLAREKGQGMAVGIDREDKDKEITIDAEIKRRKRLVGDDKRANKKVRRKTHRIGFGEKG